MATKKYAFIDRDGTIIKEPEDFQVDRLDKISLVEDVIASLLELQSMGFTLVMVTNQDGLGTDSFPGEDFHLVQNFLMEMLESQGIRFERVAVCPHREDDGCGCRKPKVGMVMPELREGVDLKRSIVVGDRQSDVGLATNMGIQGFQLGEMNWKMIIKSLKLNERKASAQRKTKETQIKIDLNLDGSGQSEISTGHGFFDHMLEQIAKHSGADLKIACTGDLHIDEHHTVEDVALCLGEALREALGNKRGIERYGFLLPMDEAQVQIALDLCDRPYFVFEGQFPRQDINGLSTEMVIHFFRSISDALRANLHMSVKGENTHHMVEACFKGFARTLRQAVQRGIEQGTPSTKGSL